MSDVPPKVPPAAPKSQGSKTLLWVVLGMLGVGALSCVGVCGGCVMFGYSTIRNTQPYQDAVAEVIASKQVQQKLGMPLREGYPTSFEYNDRGGFARFDFSVKGTNGDASVRSQSEKQAGRWNVTKLVVTFPDGEQLDLRSAGDEALSGDEALPREGTLPAEQPVP